MELRIREVVCWLYIRQLPEHESDLSSLRTSRGSDRDRCSDRPKLNFRHCKPDLRWKYISHIVLLISTLI